MRSPMLSIHSLRAGYGAAQVLMDVSLRATAGQVVTVVGPNGAGKSTLLNAIMGVIPSQGGIDFKGRPMAATTLEERVRSGIALVPETRALFTTMSVQDNLVLGAYSRQRKQRDGAELERVYALFPRLKERWRQEAGTLSGGERQMLAIGRALMGRPALLMLDEPSLGLAPLVVRDIFRIIEDLRATGVTILLVEQNARAALEVADYGYVLEMGVVAMEGEAADLAKNAQVIEAYLGKAR
ncbi:ABC transporter ATP-binding protein [Pseudacidovorax sp. NFM-22]|uniref:ABC transporter ATP-binding protein n=1 Tax=Pseudacidovorax sp. NFM-22 TaxID=2744469 RepID=UPI001F1D756D|nr:ABC transporter ATP-binding protein [Pseudacidovorax sp. NFM-22]